MIVALVAIAIPPILPNTEVGIRSIEETVPTPRAGWV